MEMNETIEGNLLIAEFIGIEVFYIDNIPKMGKYEYHDLPRYDLFWDLLMPVIEKIRSDQESCSNFNINIFGDCIIENDYKLDIHIYCDNNIDTLQATWLSTIEFIKWYNGNKGTN